MQPYCHKNNFATVVVLLLVLQTSACSGRVDPPSERFGKLEQKNTDGTDVNNVGGTASEQSAHAFDMGAEAVISDGCLHAWRTACKGDEKSAMAELEGLNKRYPKILTVEMMMGQVLEHFGKTEEAIVHYRKASVGNEWSSFNSFRLAEVYRKSGKFGQAIGIYRKLVKTAPNFQAAQIGLAQCLMHNPGGQEEAKAVIGQVLSEAPSDKVSSDQTVKLASELKVPVPPAYSAAAAQLKDPGKVSH